MKYLRKFNENSSDKDIISYLNKIFSDFIKKGSDINYDDRTYSIFINEPKMKIPLNINEYSINVNKLNEFAIDVKNRVDLVKKEFADLNVKFNLLNASRCIYLKFTMK